MCISLTMNIAIAEGKDGSDCHDGQYCIWQQYADEIDYWLLV